MEKSKNKSKKYKVRVLFEDFKERIDEELDYNEAVEKFLFYTQATLTFNMKVRCINIMNGKGTIKMFSNH